MRCVWQASICWLSTHAMNMNHLRLRHHQVCPRARKPDWHYCITTVALVTSHGHRVTPTRRHFSTHALRQWAWWLSESDCTIVKLKHAVISPIVSSNHVVLSTPWHVSSNHTALSTQLVERSEMTLRPKIPGHGHGHGKFILATHFEGSWTIWACLFGPKYNSYVCIYACMYACMHVACMHACMVWTKQILPTG